MVPCRRLNLESFKGKEKDEEKRMIEMLTLPSILLEICGG
jgi:hypothetical protein